MPPRTPQAHCRPWVRGARSPGAGPDSAARLPGLKFQLNATLGDVLSSGHLTELYKDPVVPAVRVRQCPDTHQLWRGRVLLTMQEGAGSSEVTQESGWEAGAHRPTPMAAHPLVSLDAIHLPALHPGQMDGARWVPDQ